MITQKLVRPQHSGTRFQSRANGQWIFWPIHMFLFAFFSPTQDWKYSVAYRARQRVWPSGGPMIGGGQSSIFATALLRGYWIARSKPGDDKEEGGQSETWPALCLARRDEAVVAQMAAAILEGELERQLRGLAFLGQEHPRHHMRL
jgi:hypothetical protein